MNCTGSGTVSSSSASRAIAVDDREGSSGESRLHTKARATREVQHVESISRTNPVTQCGVVCTRSRVQARREQSGQIYWARDRMWMP